jgi:hypothetical protein
VAPLEQQKTANEFRSTAIGGLSRVRYVCVCVCVFSLLFYFFRGPKRLPHFRPISAPFPPHSAPFFWDGRFRSGHPQNFEGPRLPHFRPISAPFCPIFQTRSECVGCAVGDPLSLDQDGSVRCCLKFCWCRQPSLARNEWIVMDGGARSERLALCSARVVPSARGDGRVGHLRADIHRGRAGEGMGGRTVARM